jgi:hypothetical protein
MCKKLILLVSIIVVLVLTSGAGAADPDLVGWRLTTVQEYAIDHLHPPDGTINNAAAAWRGGSAWFDDPGIMVLF